MHIGIKEEIVTYNKMQKHDGVPVADYVDKSRTTHKMEMITKWQRQNLFDT